MRASFPKTAFPEAFPCGRQRPYPTLRSLSPDRKNKGHFCARALEACSLQ
jgi:hypothetical protein